MSDLRWFSLSQLKWCFSRSENFTERQAVGENLLLSANWINNSVSAVKDALLASPILGLYFLWPQFSYVQPLLHSTLRPVSFP
jgi:hypothetical protein